MSGWANPPVVEKVASKSAERVVYVHPLDHARLTEYVHAMFDHMDREHASMPGVMAFLRSNRREMIDLMIPNPEVPANYMRVTTGEISFFEVKVTKFFTGLEDRSKFPKDIDTLKSVLSEVI